MTKDEVVCGSLWQATVFAAFQRAKMYSDVVQDSDRRGLKKTLEKEINKLLPNYKSFVTEEDHIRNIVSIVSAINKEWSFCLINQEIPIGVVQKAFNLYLKLMWCTNKIFEPPHCPIDKIIIDKLPLKQRKSWTKIRDIETYETLVAELKKVAGTKSLAVWELESYAKP